jgi:hypothetical protein
LIKINPALQDRLSIGSNALAQTPRTEKDAKRTPQRSGGDHEWISRRSGRSSDEFTALVNKSFLEMLLNRVEFLLFSPKGRISEWLIIRR